MLAALITHWAVRYSRLVFTVGLREKVYAEQIRGRTRRYKMDQQKMWENKLKRSTKVENAIAVAGLKAALLVGEKIY